MAETIEQARDRLIRVLGREKQLLKKPDDYYEGEQPLKFVSH